ncbi:MAG: hypothetical protein OEW52_09045 [Thermoleophilia bacterium]|nr:hypothetical protein [Thermoleophilia bacterium]
MAELLKRPRDRDDPGYPATSSREKLVIKMAEGTWGALDPDPAISDPAGGKAAPGNIPGDKARRALLEDELPPEFAGLGELQAAYREAVAMGTRRGPGRCVRSPSGRLGNRSS